MKHVLKWPVRVDGHPHAIGAGPVVHVDVSPNSAAGAFVDVWTEEPDDGEQNIPARVVQVFGTGHPIPDDATHLGSVVASPYVWHIYEVPAR